MKTKIFALLMFLLILIPLTSSEGIRIVGTSLIRGGSYNYSLATFSMWNTIWSAAGAGGVDSQKTGDGVTTFNNSVSISVNTTWSNLTFVRVNETYYTLFTFEDTNATTECNLGELLDGSSACVDYNNTIDQKISSVTYLPHNITTQAGTFIAGNISSIQYIDDGENYTVKEGMGVNPLTVIINFTNVNDIDFMLINAWYEGGAGHEIAIGLWDYDDGEFEEEYGFIEDMDGFELLKRDVFDADEHIDPVNGNVSLRLRHVNLGNQLHHLHLDYVVLVEGFSTLTNTDHDALSGRENPNSNHPVYNTRINRLNESYNITDYPLTNINGNLSIPKADTVTSGYLDTTDWSKFNTAYALRIMIAVAPLDISPAREISLVFNPSDFLTQGGTTFTILDAGINHTDTFGYLAKQHINWTDPVGENLSAENLTVYGDTACTGNLTFDTGSMLLVGTGEASFCASVDSDACNYFRNNPARFAWTDRDGDEIFSIETDTLSINASHNMSFGWSIDYKLEDHYGLRVPSNSPAFCADAALNACNYFRTGGVGNRYAWTDLGGVERAYITLTGEGNLAGISGDGAGKVVCIKANGDLGTCTTGVGVGGTCSCA